MAPVDETKDFPLKRFLGMEIDSARSGQARAHVRIGPDHLNPFGAAHGAVVFAMIDTSMGRAATTVLEEGQLCATIDVQVRFIRPIRGGEARADTRIIHRGRRIIHLESKVTDADGRLLATGTGTFAVTSTDPA
jgi:acyl-CoA thioesterase